jgi:ketosteroid isomerase-like protein
MKQGIRWIGPLLLFLGISMTVGAQGKDSEEARVRSLDEQERVAVLKSDRIALERLWSDSFTVNAPTNRVNVGRAAVLDVVAKGGMHYSVFERKAETVRVDGDIGIVMGSETVVPVPSGTAAPASIARRFTNIWKKERGTWRMIARHANVIAP